MSNDNSTTVLKNCDNHYTLDELFDVFGMSETETKICLSCTNHRIEGGIITCKYILEGCDKS